MKKLTHLLLFITIGTVCLIDLFAQDNYHRLSGFQNSPFFDEQVLTYNYKNEVKITINAPSPQKFNPERPIIISLFALPNGNTTEQTIGKIMEDGDDWHFDIQHIGAQTRFLRNQQNDINYVTVYLENNLLSWPSWKAKYSNHAEIVKNIVKDIRDIFGKYENSVVLTGHSGGGRFIFSFMDAYTEIPSFIKRISFLDSNYGYEEKYGKKIINWLNSSEDNYLSVIAYNDSVALYNGKPIVSETGGTWYRSRMMKKFMSSYFTFTDSENSEFINYEAINGRVKIFLKKNPMQKILHTIQVERNGYIQGMVSGTAYEGVSYSYYGNRAYSDFIQREIVYLEPLKIPPRSPEAISGSQFMESIKTLSFEAREERILEEISSGNIPNFLRSLTKIESNFIDANGISHSVIYEVMPDYLAIGSDDDFCRIPMGPIAAQKIADLFGASMPTSKLVDNIYVNSKVKLAPKFYTPVGNENEKVAKFILHNNDIENARLASGGNLGELTGGIKKDVIISNKITDPTRTHHVVIYGWHQLNGNPIQPIYNGHIDAYVDYSHGIRLINSQILIDSVITEYKSILTDEVLYKTLSNENGPMERPTYLKLSGLPERPNSFGIINYGSDKLKIIIKNNVEVKSYKIYLSSDGLNFNEPIIANSDNLVLDGLSEDLIYYIKIKSTNIVGDSPYSELLACVPSSNNDLDVLIVNGFDRASNGNTYNFIRQHASAFKENGKSFNSATNDGVLDGIFDLEDYFLVDFILGEESTVDESFSTTEQSLVSNFLKNGGNLFVSGAEIAWDLDHKGSSSDKSFIWNYLKMQYAADAPFSQSGTYYTVNLVPNDFIGSINQFSFDNGTHGTYNVKYPDVVYPKGDAVGFIQYTALNTQNGFAGVIFDGLFPGGSTSGKILALGFPFETIYPESVRNDFMHEAVDFFYSTSSIDNDESSADNLKFNLAQNYPNPFNPSTTIKYSIPVGNGNAHSTTNVGLKIYDILGREVATLVNKEQLPGNYSVEFDASNLTSGIFVYRLQSGSFVASKKMVLVK